MILPFSNNQDREKVLGTVAATLLEFTLYFPNALVYAQGSTGSRTRMYQIGISLNWHKIDPLFNIFGYKEVGGWELFRKNAPYQAFLIRRR